jgi:hypothetical protein
MPLTISASGVTVTAYGTGSNPVIRLSSDGAAVSVTGSHNVVENLPLAGTAPRTWSCGGRRTPAGHGDGVDIHAGAFGVLLWGDGNTVEGNTITGTCNPASACS